MTLLDASMNGLELRHAVLGSYAVDFVSIGRGHTLIMRLDWWRHEFDRTEFHYVKNIPVARGENVWALRFKSNDGVLAPVSSYSNHGDLRRARDYQDLDRGGYGARLIGLHAQFPEQEHILPWREKFLDRPTVDPVAELRKQNLGAREIGLLPLVSSDGVSLVDVLAIDMHGNIGIAQENGWLRSIGEQWLYATERPDMGEFLKWAAGQRPHGFEFPGEPRTIKTEGSVKGVAIQLLSGTL